MNSCLGDKVMSEMLFRAAEFVCDSVLANRVSLNARNELYHFLMAVNEYGLEAVVDETKKLLMENGYSYFNASRMALERAAYMLEVASGERTYHTVRERLDSPEGAPNPSSHTASIYKN